MAPVSLETRRRWSGSRGQRVMSFEDPPKGTRQARCVSISCVDEQDSSTWLLPSCVPMLPAELVGVGFLGGLVHSRADLPLQSGCACSFLEFMRTVNVIPPENTGLRGRPVLCLLLAVIPGLSPVTGANLMLHKYLRID